MYLFRRVHPASSPVDSVQFLIIGFDEAYPLWTISSVASGGLDWTTPEVGQVRGNWGQPASKQAPPLLDSYFRFIHVMCSGSSEEYIVSVCTVGLRLAGEVLFQNIPMLGHENIVVFSNGPWRALGL